MPAMLIAGGRSPCLIFDDKGPGSKNGRVPVKTIKTAAGDLLVTTVFDLMTAQLGIARAEDDGLQARHLGALPHRL